MSRYRRARVPGGTFVFTVALADRTAGTLVDRIADLRGACGAARERLPFRTEGIVVLPDHLHAVWTLPPGDADFSTRWTVIKGEFSRQCGAAGIVRPSLARKDEAGVWQRRFWEHRVRDEDDLARCLEYCWINPVKHGLVENPSDWPFSSFAVRGKVSP